MFCGINLHHSLQANGRSLRGCILLPEYLERWFNVSIWVPACNNVTLIDWIYFELLTRLKTMCAVQLNTSWNQIGGACGIALVPVRKCTVTAFSLSNGCLQMTSLPSSSHWLKGWDDLCGCCQLDPCSSGSFQHDMVSERERERKGTKIGTVFHPHIQDKNVRMPSSLLSLFENRIFYWKSEVIDSVAFLYLKN